MTPSAIVMMLLFAGAPAVATEAPHTGTHPPERSTDPHPGVEAITRIIARFGDPLLRAPDPVELNRLVKATLADEEFRLGLSTLVTAVNDLRAAFPADVAASIDKAIEPLPRSLQTLVRQGMAITAEIMHRVPDIGTLPPSLVREAFTELLSSDDPDAREAASAALNLALYGFGLAQLLDHPSTPFVPGVAATIVERWYDADRALLRRVDPLQKALDDAIPGFPGITQESLLRLTYAWEAGGDSGPALVIWLVLSEDAPEPARVVSGNPALVGPLAEQLALVAPGTPFFLRLRLADEWV